MHAPSDTPAVAAVPAPPAGQQPFRLSSVVEFVEAIPGFPEEKNFTFGPIDSGNVLFAFRSLRTPGLRFIVMPPARFFPDYEPELDEAEVAALGLSDEDEVQVLLIVSVQNGIADATANLLAPIVLSVEHGRAMQVVLADDRLPLRAPLLRAAS